ncbi:TIGR03758 family integrating conjugative element protein [Xenorhabdus santafensis]|uniref:TIGR03758 family integrating conjugative element protein n=1 Tax=Xenorhabdus santafensis TaxID=2582833 RepID=UPI0029E7CCBA|nr:TIGR03758 family integrating conjugative element protein [Xenorhabdus sp. 12]
MTPTQRNAFEVASGHFDIHFLYLVCVGFFLATLFLWAAWAAVDVWNGWANEKVRNQIFPSTPILPKVCGSPRRCLILTRGLVV